MKVCSVADQERPGSGSHVAQLQVKLTGFSLRFP